MLLEPVDRKAKLVTHVDRALGLSSFDTGAALLGHAYADAHSRAPRIVGPGGWQPGAQWRGDGWENSVTGFGTHLDKTTYGQFRLSTMLSDSALDQLFHGDDIVERMITTVPKEMLRKGYGLVLGDKPGSDAESKILKALEALEANEQIMQAMWWAALFGGGALVLGADDGRPASLPLIPELVRKIDWVEAYDRRYYAIATYYTDGPNYGKPETYAVGNPGMTVSPMHIVHESRMIHFDGAPTSIMMKRARGGYSISKLQRCYETIRSFATSYKAVEILLTDGPQGVYKVDNLASLLGSNNKGAFEARLQAVDLFRSAMRAVVVDAKTESFERQQISFGSIPDVMDRFALRLAAAVPMPVTKLMGQSPAGMNATGDSDFRDWYDGIETDQTNKLAPKLCRLISILCATKEGPTGGKQPKQIKIEFQKLWTLNPKEEAERRLIVAQTDVAYETMGAITPDEIALNRFGERGWSDTYEIDRDLRETLVERDHEERSAETDPVPPKDALTPSSNEAIVTVDEARAMLGLEPDEDPEVGAMKLGELKAKQAAAEAPGSHPTDPEQNKPDGFDVQDPAEVAAAEAEAKAAALGAAPGKKPNGTAGTAPNKAGTRGPSGPPKKAPAKK
jgi:uncharacterized protein